MQKIDRPLGQFGERKIGCELNNISGCLTWLNYSIPYSEEVVHVLTDLT